MYGCVAGTCTNISAGITCGLIAGLISAIISGKFGNNKKTSFGGADLAVVAGLASIIIAPIIIIALYNNDVNLSTLWRSNISDSNAIISDTNVAGEIVAKYAGVSAGISIVCGLIVGLFLKCMAGEYQMPFFDE